MAAESSLQDGQAFGTAKSAHALRGVDHGTDGPALDHPSVAPTADVLAELTNPADQVLDLIRADQTARRMRPSRISIAEFCPKGSLWIQDCQRGTGGRRDLVVP